MRADQQSASHPILARTPWLFEIAKQLRVEYSAVGQIEPMPERMAELIRQLEAGDK